MWKAVLAEIVRWCLRLVEPPGQPDPPVILLIGGDVMALKYSAKLSAPRGPVADRLLQLTVGDVALPPVHLPPDTLEYTFLLERGDAERAGTAVLTDSDENGNTKASPAGTFAVPGPVPPPAVLIEAPDAPAVTLVGEV